MAFVSHDVSATGRWDVVFELVDALAARWPEKRSAAVAGALRGWTQEAIGELWKPPIEQPTVNRHLRAAGWPAVERAIVEFQVYWDVFDGK